MNLIEIDQQLLKNITGGCFCYCFTNPYNISMTNLFVKETASEQECRSVCTENKKYPYYGYADCSEGLYELYRPDEIKYPQKIIDALGYQNGGWKINFPDFNK